MAASEIRYVYWSGQSLARGRLGSPPINNSQPFSPPNLKIWPKWFNTGIASATFADLIADEPLTRSGGPANYEEPGIGMANTLRQLQGGAGSPQILVDNHGVGGRCYAALRRGASTLETYAAGTPPVFPFDDAVGNHFGTPPRDNPNTLTRAKDLATAQGDTLSVLAILITHGECDLETQTAATYAGYLVDWRTTFNQEASYVMGAPVSAPLFTSQFSSWGRAGLKQPVTGTGIDSTPIGHWYAARDNPNSIGLVAPHYPFPYQNDALHLTAAGYERLGGYYAKALNKWIAQGKIWRPVAPRSINFSGTEVTARFHVPVPPLVFDTAAVVNPGDYGFELWRGTTRLTLTEVTLVDGETVRITAAEALDGTEKLRYAYTGCAGLTCSGPVNGPRGNLRDSDTTQVQRIAVELPNWAVTFNEPIAGFVWDPDPAPQPLTISDLSAAAGETAATITWTTNRPANSRVEYGTSPTALDRAADSAGLVTSHTAILTGLTASTTYYYRVRSSDGLGTHAVSPGVPDSSAFTTTADTAPPVISAIAATPAETQAVVQWTTDEPATARVDYGTEPGALNLQVSSPALSLHAVLTLPGLTAATTYYYRVTAADAAGNSTTSPALPLSFVTSGDATPPVISAITATPGQTQATISWTTDEPATSRVDYGTSASNLSLTATSAGLATGHSLTLTGLTQNRTYYYRVSSADARSNNVVLPAPPAPPLTFQTTGDTTPPTISSIIVTPGSTTTTIRWTTSESATSRVDYGLAPDALTLNVSTTSRATTRTMTLTGLTAGETYYFRLGSADAAGNAVTHPAPPAAPLSFSTDNVPPVISGIVVTPGITTATIKWVTSESATSRVDYGVAPNALALNVSTTSRATTRTMTLTGLTAGETYYFRLGSADAAGNAVTHPASPAAPLSLSTDNVPPVISGVVLTPGITTATIKWVTSESATSRIDYGVAPDALVLNVVKTSRNTSRTMALSDLTPNVTYYFRLTSADAAGNAAIFPPLASPPLSFLTDATPPVISAVTATSARTTATIRWTTNEAANSSIDYGVSPAALTLNDKRTSLVVSRSLTLQPLAPGTTYYYRVTSADAAGNTSIFPPPLSPPLTVTTTAVPVSLTVLTGTPAAGNPASLLAADNDHFEVASAVEGAAQVAEWYGVLPNIPNTTPGLKLTYKGGNTATCSQTISFWNWTTAAWTVVDTRNVGPTEVGRSNLTPPGAPSSYIGGGTNEVRVRLRCSTSAPFRALAEYLWLTF